MLSIVSIDIKLTRTPTRTPTPTPTLPLTRPGAAADGTAVAPHAARSLPPRAGRSCGGDAVPRAVPPRAAHPARTRALA